MIQSYLVIATYYFFSSNFSIVYEILLQKFQSKIIASLSSLSGLASMSFKWFYTGVSVLTESHEMESYTLAMLCMYNYIMYICCNYILGLIPRVLGCVCITPWKNHVAYTRLDDMKSNHVFVSHDVIQKLNHSFPDFNNWSLDGSS